MGLFPLYFLRITTRLGVLPETSFEVFDLCRALADHSRISLSFRGHGVRIEMMLFLYFSFSSDHSKAARFPLALEPPTKPARRTASSGGRAIPAFSRVPFYPIFWPFARQTLPIIAVQ